MKLLLSTLHAKHTHSSLALPYLSAGCSRIKGLTTVIHEFTVNSRLENILPQLAAEGADIIAFSCYIWNIEQTLRLAADLKLLHPDCCIILGGPEVSYGSHELMAANGFIDCIVRGEGEETFFELLKLQAGSLFAFLPEEQMASICGITFRNGEEILTTPARKEINNLDSIPSPFSAGMVDTAKPLIYFESSRGCPFSCAFCLSSLESSVRAFSFARVKSDLEILIKQQVSTIKFVDRTFNYDATRANQLWGLILSENRNSRFHFEIAAELLTDDNIRLLQQVPADTFRFEIGVQSAAPETLATVGRKSDLQNLFYNVARIRQETAVTLHLDLVAGLPGEDFDGFVSSLESLLTARPHYIQVEPLKVLKGTAMRKIARELGYSFSPYPPYRILKNRWLSFSDICRIEAVAMALDRFYNSGRFAATLEMLARKISLAELFTAPDLEKILSEGNDSRISTVFLSFFRLAENLLPAELLQETTDALRFDYYMTGYPGNDLPAFLTGDSSISAKIRPIFQHQEIARLLAIPEDCRIRTHTASFRKDHTGNHSQPGNYLITFAYFNLGSRESVRAISIPMQ